MGDVRIDREALTAIVAHARRDAPQECCGLLVGRPAGAGVPIPDILEAVPAANAASDPTRRYEVSPADYLAQVTRCRTISAAQSETFAVLGAYHSHPRGGPEPSPADIADAFRDFLFVIVGLAGAAGGMEIRGYALDGGTLSPLELIVVD